MCSMATVAGAASWPGGRGRRARRIGTRDLPRENDEVLGNQGEITRRGVDPAPGMLKRMCRLQRF